MRADGGSRSTGRNTICKTTQVFSEEALRGIPCELAACFSDNSHSYISFWPASAPGTDLGLGLTSPLQGSPLGFLGMCTCGLEQEKRPGHLGYVGCSKKDLAETLSHAYEALSCWSSALATMLFHAI